MSKMITVYYKCRCMQDAGSFPMLERGKHEEAMAFMGRVTEVLGRDHSKRNPLCQATEVEWVKLHAPKDKGLGFAEDVAS